MHAMSRAKPISFTFLHIAFIKNPKAKKGCEESATILKAYGLHVEMVVRSPVLLI